jgi:hypothetical protein
MASGNPEGERATAAAAAPALAIEAGAPEQRGSGQRQRFLDELGPVVLNSDGTISRITNWQQMTPSEQAATQRIIAKRNQARKAQLLASSTPAPK